MSLDAAGGFAVSPAQGAPLRPVLPPLPYGFRPVRLGDLVHAKHLSPGDHPVTRRRPRGASPSQRAGLRYQRQVCDELRKLFKSPGVLVGPWLEYRALLGLQYCQPDAVAHVGDRTYVFEVKLSSTTDAWWQLRHLYGPVVQYLFPKQRIILVNVVKSYYPEIRFPEDTWTFSMGLDGFLERSSVESIIQWRVGI